MSNFIYVNKYSGAEPFNPLATPIGVEAIKREDTENSYILTHGSITSATASLELENTNTDYQTTGAAKVILIIQGGSSLTDFEIFQGDSADAATLQLEDFPSVSISATQFITSKVLTIAASKYISVKANTGTISSVTAILIE